MADTATAATPATATQAPQWYVDMMNMVARFKRENGRGPTREEWSRIFTTVAPKISAEVAGQLYDRGMYYTQLTGAPATPEVLSEWITSLGGSTSVPGSEPSIERDREENRRQEAAAQAEFNRAREETRRLEELARTTGYVGNRPTLAREIEDARQRENAARQALDEQRETARQEEEKGRQTGYYKGEQTVAGRESEARIAAEKERLANEKAELLGYLQGPEGQQLPTLKRQEIEAQIRQKDQDLKRLDQEQSGWITDAQGNRTATFGREQYAGDLFKSLSGAQDWVKAQMAEANLPEGSLGDLAKAFGRGPAFGAVTPDASNSWESKLAPLLSGRPQDEVPWVNGALPGQGLPGYAQGALNPAMAQRPRESSPEQQNIDRAYNDALMKAGKRTEDFRSAPPGWQPGMPLPGQQASGQVPWVNQAALQPVGQGPGGGQLTRELESAPDPGRRLLGGPTPGAGPGSQPGQGQPQPTLRTRMQGTEPTQQQPARQYSREDFARDLGQRQPIQISTSTFNKMSPTQRAMQAGAWSAQALDPTDMWEKMRKAQPGGQLGTTRKTWR